MSDQVDLRGIWYGLRDILFPSDELYMFTSRCMVISRAAVRLKFLIANYLAIKKINLS